MRDLPVLQVPSGADDPAYELAVAQAMVDHARDPTSPPLIRAYRAGAAVVAFGRRDSRLPGFPDAARAARAHGFIPLIRAAGGRAVAYTDACLILDHASHDPNPWQQQEARFARFGAAYVAELANLGVAARLGPVPGEYCPGAHSVNARGVVKLIGTAQRITFGSWLFSSVVIVDDADPIRAVLADVYAALGQPFEAGSVGSLRLERRDLPVDELIRLLLGAHGADWQAQPVLADPTLLARARELAPRHRP